MKYVCVMLLTIVSLGCGYSAMNNGMTNGNVQVMQVMPNSETAGSMAFMMTVNGTGFAMGSVAYWNGMALSTQFVSASQVVARVPPSLVSMSGMAQVYVRSNGSNSNTMNVTVN